MRIIRISSTRDNGTLRSAITYKIHASLTITNLSCIQPLHQNEIKYQGETVSILCPIDPSIPKRAIRFKLSARTGNPLLWVSQNLPANEATGHPPPPNAECKQTKKSMGSRNAPIVHCGLHALEVINLNVMASNLPKSIIFITERHLYVFLTPAVSSNSRK